MFLKYTVFILLFFILVLLFIIWRKHQNEQRLQQEINLAKRMNYNQQVQQQQMRDSMLLNSQSQIDSNTFNDLNNYSSTHNNSIYESMGPISQSQVQFDSMMSGPRSRSRSRSRQPTNYSQSQYSFRSGSLQETLSKPRIYLEQFQDLQRTTQKYGLRNRNMNKNGMNNGSTDGLDFMKERFDNFDQWHRQ